MANSHMQRNSTSFVIKELQFIIIVRWYYMPFKMANIKKKKKLTTYTADKDIELQGSLTHCWCECRTVYFGGEFGRFL